MAKQPQTIGTEVGGKISAKGLGFDKLSILERVIANKDTEVFLFRVIGQAIDVQAYKSKFDDKDEEEEGFGLVGNYHIETVDGEVLDYNAATLYLPGVAHKALVAAVQQGNFADLALDVYAKFSDKAATSYIFIVRTLVEPDRSAVDRLMSMIGKTPLPALPKS